MGQRVKNVTTAIMTIVVREAVESSPNGLLVDINFFFFFFGERKRLLDCFFGFISCLCFDLSLASVFVTFFFVAFQDRKRTK